MLLICSALPRGTRLPGGGGGAEVYFAAFPPGASVIELQAAMAAGCNNARASLTHPDSGLTWFIDDQIINTHYTSWQAYPQISSRR